MCMQEILDDWPLRGIDVEKLSSEALQVKVDELNSRCRELESRIGAPVHRPLGPDTSGINHKVEIDKINVYITTEEYEDGTLGALSMRIDKQGGTLRIYGQWLEDVSWCLQHGLPLSGFIERWKYQNMVPFGVTSNPEIMMAKSIMDYLARWLEIKYPDGKRRECHSR